MPDRTSKKKPRRDTNLLAKSVVDQATGEEGTSGKNPAAVALGRLGGKKGGRVRAMRLSAERRKEIARKAAQARWHRKKDDES